MSFTSPSLFPARVKLNSFLRAVICQVSKTQPLFLVIFLRGLPELHIPVEPLKSTSWSRDATSPKCHFSFFTPAGCLLLQNCVTLLTHEPWCPSPRSLACHGHCLAGHSPSVHMVNQSYHTGHNMCPVFLDQISVCHNC